MSKPRALYLNLADEIRALIEGRIFKPGERLPSVRALSRSKGVSIPTVTSAFQYLEDQGLIRARPQSGYYVLEPQAPAPGGVWTLRNADYARIIERIRDGENLAPFDMAMQDDAFYPVHKLSAIMAGQLRQDPGMLGRSTLALGDEGLREQIAKRLVGWNCLIEPEDLVITNGGLEAINLCLRALTRPGDTVVVECPTYYGFLNLIESCGLRALEVASDPLEGISLEGLDRALGREPVQACLLSTTVSNPLGVTLSPDRKRRLLEILEAHGVPLVEDATFADLAYDARPAAVQGLDLKRNVLLCASLTKTLAPGFRLGWVYGGRFSREVCSLKRIFSGDQPEILQRTLRTYLENGSYERHLRKARHELQLRLQGTLEVIRTSFPEGTRWSSPTGGYLLWVELPHPVERDRLLALASRLGLRVAPGRIFSTSGTFDRHLRLNYAQADTARLFANLALLGESL